MTGSPERLRAVSWSGLGEASREILKHLLFASTALCFFALWFFNPQAGRFLFVLPPLALLAVLFRGTHVRAWAVYIIGFLVFVDLRMISAEVFFPARYDYVIALERLLFGGAVPSQWLQSRFYSLGTTTALDAGLIAVHFSFFLVPHVVAIVAWHRSSTLFRRYVLATMATCYTGLVAAFLLPTAPPWLAGTAQRIPHVHRIIRDVLLGLTPETYVATQRAVGENAVAAMPSLHMALTCLVALAMSAVSRTAGRVGWGYAAAMSVALVYLGEHYVIDLLAGGAVAAIFWRVAGNPPNVVFRARPRGDAAVK